MKNSQSGEIVTLISIITLVALTIFTAFSSQFIAQKQTINTKASLDCSGYVANYECDYGYGYSEEYGACIKEVCDVQAEWDSDLGYDHDYVCPTGYYRNVDSCCYISYGGKTPICSDGYSWYSESGSCCREVADVPVSSINSEESETGLEKTIMEIPNPDESISPTGIPDSTQGSDARGDEYCSSSDQECLLDYVGDSGFLYQAECYDGSRSVGACFIDGVSGVCCNSLKKTASLKIEGQQVEENQNISIDGLSVSAEVNDNFDATYSENDSADVYLNPQGDGSFKPTCDAGVTLHINTDSEYELVDESGKVVQTGTSFNLCN